MRLLYLLILTLLLSCGQKSDQKTADAIDEAQTFLTKHDCQSAIDLLEESGRANGNPLYVQVLASAYACKAGHSEIAFIEQDIPLLSSGSGDFLASLTLFHLSDETEADSANYTNLKEALNIILHADGGEEPSQVNRNLFFGNRKSGDLSLQALYMGLVQLGKFLNYYGNVGATGVKGQGPKTSKCFLSYTGDALTYVTLQPSGSCNGGGLGHPDLNVTADAATAKRRMCEGLLLITNIIDILNNISLPDNESLEDLGDVVATVNQFKTAATAIDPSLSELLETTSQVQCEEFVSTSSGYDKLQKIYAALFETGLP